MINNPYQKYNTNKVLTASPAELTLMLYEGAIKFCNLAAAAIDKKDIQQAHNNIIKAEKILEELQTSLNHSYEVAKDFDIVYDYIYQLLLQANIHKDKEKLEKATEEFRSMRDIWKQIMRAPRNM